MREDASASGEWACGAWLLQRIHLAEAAHGAAWMCGLAWLEGKKQVELGVC